jgi:two-component system sensor histidine kinase PilS (NtrC family)
MSKQEASTPIETRLIWLMVLRVLVVTILLGLAVATEVIARPETPVHPLYSLIAITYFLTLLYALAWPFTGAYRRPMAYVQIAGDLIIVSGLVFFTGGVESSFSRLYFISIIAASIILYRRGGLATAGAASILYAAVLELVHWGILPGYPFLGAFYPVPSQTLHFSIFLNTFLYFTVALLTSYLSESLREKGRELEVASDHLADLQAFNQTVIDSLTSGLMTTDVEGRINFFNDAAQAILKVKSAQAVGRKASEILGEDDGFIARIDSMLQERRYCRMEGAYLNGHGDEIYLGLSVSHLLFQGEGRSGFLFTFQDLTEIKRLENEVRLKENLATMGEMAAGMAHEIRNPLASISGSVQVLQEELGLSGEQSRLMDIIVRESERLSSILNEFLVYARPPKFEPRNLDLREVVGETVALLENSAEVQPEHQIVLKLPETAVKLFADANHIKQIAWNLARNALQAMPEGGRLEVELGRNGSGEVVMAFRVQGVGLSEGEVHQVFQPFSGKFERGSGLGLAIVYRIVKDYNGVIRVDSASPRGTEISVHFPLGRRTIG